MSTLMQQQVSVNERKKVSAQIKQNEAFDSRVIWTEPRAVHKAASVNMLWLQSCLSMTTGHLHLGLSPSKYPNLVGFNSIIAKD